MSNTLASQKQALLDQLAAVEQQEAAAALKPIEPGDVMGVASVALDRLSAAAGVNLADPQTVVGKVLAEADRISHALETTQVRGDIATLVAQAGTAAAMLHLLVAAVSGGHAIAPPEQLPHDKDHGGDAAHS